MVESGQSFLLETLTFMILLCCWKILPNILWAGWLFSSSVTVCPQHLYQLVKS